MGPRTEPCGTPEDTSNKCKSAYIENIERFLSSCGFSGIWQSHDVIKKKSSMVIAGNKTKT